MIHSSYLCSCLHVHVVCHTFFARMINCFTKLFSTRKIIFPNYSRLTFAYYSASAPPIVGKNAKKVQYKRDAAQFCFPQMLKSTFFEVFSNGTV